MTGSARRSGKRTLVSLTATEAALIDDAMARRFDDAERDGLWRPYGEKQSFLRAWAKVQTATPSVQPYFTEEAPGA